MSSDDVDRARADDLERQRVISSAPAREQYGAVPEPDEDKGEPPLLFGRFAVSPSNLVYILVGFYVIVFAVMTLADIAYYNTVDGRFPKGMEHIYPSEEERKATVSYTRQNLLCMRLHAICVFIVVMCFVYFQVFTKADAWLHATTAYLKEKWDYYWQESCWCLPFRNCWNVVLQFLCCFLIPFKSCFDHCVRSCDCCCGPVRRAFSDHNWLLLLHGSVYLALIGTLFFLVSVPFMHWKMSIDLDFGFTNALTVTEASFREKLWSEFFTVLIFSVPMSFGLLTIIKFRFGWLFLWVLLVGGMIWVNLNMAIFGPLALDLNNIFPHSVFAVGRGFPIERTGNKTSPWISLNRIYFDNTPPGPKQWPRQWITNDKHKGGQLVVGFDQSANSWAISGRGDKVYAVAGGSPDLNMESLSGKTWTGVDGKESGQLGARSGEELREKVMSFAEHENVNIQEIYMVDGSHADARANAFVGGINGSIIGLYDTLFLGDHPKNFQKDEANKGLFFMLNGKSSIRTLSQKIQSVDVPDEDDMEVWESAPTQAMTDNEIVSILAHELAHASHHHMERGLAVQAAVSLLTFAALGWAVHSPLLAIGLGLSSPLLWVGACVHSHLLGPPLDATLALFSNWHTRVGEYEADAYVATLSLTYANALQNSLAKLAVNANQDPDYPYWYEMLHDDHPTVAHRWEAIEAVKQDKYGVQQ